MQCTVYFIFFRWGFKECGKVKKITEQQFFSALLLLPLLSRKLCFQHFNLFILNILWGIDTYTHEHRMNYIEGNEQLAFFNTKSNESRKLLYLLSLFCSAFSNEMLEVIIDI